ncbi:MAG: hypothetical protein ABI763_04560 [Bacteroidota bacterium]
MEAIYRLKSSELNENFVKLIRKLFKNKDVEITITAANDKKGKDEFMKAVEDVRLRKNIVSFTSDDFKKYTSQLSTK